MSLDARRRRPPTPGFVANDLWRRAGAVPSFDINPGELGHVRDLVTGTTLGGGTVNSATPAWDTGPDGILFQPAANSPVVGFDPVTLRPVGLRGWGSQTNLSLQSELIGASPWGTNNSAAVTYTSNAAVSPKGTATARRVTATADFAGPNQFASVTSGAAYTVSVFVKAVSSGSLDEIRLELFGYFLRFKISTQAFSQVNASFTSYGAVNYGNGWYRLYASALAPSTGSLAYSFYAYQSSDVYMFGSQLQTGSVAGPYVPTTATAASSTADAIDITSLTGGINNIRTIYARVRTPASGIRGIISLNDNSSSNRLELLTNGTDPRAVAVTSGSTVADIDGGTIAANTAFNIAARFDGDNYAVSVNGAPVVTDNAGARAIVDRIFLGRTQAGEYLNGYIERLATWTTPVGDARLRALTS